MFFSPSLRRTFVNGHLQKGIIISGAVDDRHTWNNILQYYNTATLIYFVMFVIIIGTVKTRVIIETFTTKTRNICINYSEVNIIIN